jgi:hypothetical protein
MGTGRTVSVIKTTGASNISHFSRGVIRNRPAGVKTTQPNQREGVPRTEENSLCLLALAVCNEN